MKRKFDSNRLYKLTRNAVIVVSLIAMLGAMLSWRNTRDAERRWMIVSKECDKVKSDDQKWLQCQQGAPDFELKVQEATANTFVQDLTLAIVLPLVFFSVVATYRYIFPIKQ